MKKLKRSLPIIAAFVCSLFVGTAVAIPIAELLCVNVLPVASTLIASPFLTKFTVAYIRGYQEKSTLNYAIMAVEREIWVDYIIGNLFKDNSFLNSVYSEDQYVVGGSVVHIPQAGSKATVVKNRSTLPSTVGKRTDTEISYVLDEFTSDPILIPNADTVQLSYDKMNNVMTETRDSINETVSDSIIFNWRVTSASNIIRTSGATSYTSHMPGSTGTRKQFTKEDLKRARTLMNKQNVPKDNRFCLMSEDMFDQLQDDADLKKRDGMNGGELNLAEGTVGRLSGFQIYTRSSVLTYDNASTPVPKALAAATAVTDNDCVLCWQKNSLARALGTVEFFEQLKHPQFYGDVYSALLRMGGRQRRTNGEGVVAIVQAP